MNRVALWAGLAFAMGVVLILGQRPLVDRGAPTWVLIVPLAFTCAGVLVRTRAPLGSLGLGVVGIVIDGFVGPSLATILVFTDNLYAAALYGPARFARVLLGVATVLAVVAGALAGFLAEDWRALAVMGVQAGLVLITPVTTALVLREQRDRAAAARARAEQMARLAELDRQAAITAERTRMARELHDMIANHFSAIAIQSTAALSRKDLDRETVRKIMESVRENSVKGMAEMRAMIGLLRQEGDEGDNEATRPRLADAETLVDRVRQAGMDVELRVEGEVRELHAPIDLAGYRILQEALTNALKHGESPVSVVVAYEKERVRVSVGNALGGRRKAVGLPGAGAGLIGMRERAALVGGFFEAGDISYEDGASGGEEAKRDGGDAGGGGWRVLAVLPTAEGGELGQGVARLELAETSAEGVDKASSGSDRGAGHMGERNGGGW
ncbi:histidine kinase [Nonomuraea sp. NPDC050404]|uniref:sensor histidine kinase n=1 Tax=Nonomuraea sp. NPDC050404 TaxID=3155783 RepID=UPI0033DFFA14